VIAIIFKSHHFGTSVAQVIIRNIEEDVKTGLEALASEHRLTQAQGSLVELMRPAARHR